MPDSNNNKNNMKSFAEWSPVMLMIAVDLAFAFSNIVLKKIVSEGFNRLVFITYRQSVSAIFITPLAFFVERKSRPKITVNILCQLFMSALLGVAATQYLFLLGIEYTSATYACAFLNMVPVVTFLMALPFGQEKLNLKQNSGRAKLLGSLVCLGGTILLSCYKGMSLIHFSNSQHVDRSTGEVSVDSNSHVERGRWAIGSLSLFAATLCWSSWFILQNMVGKKYPCQYSSTAIMSCFSALQSAILSLSIDRKLSIWFLKKKSDIFIILYAGMIGSGLCFVAMSWCVKKRGPVFTAAFSPLVQIMAAMYEIPVNHEQLHLGILIGSSAVIVGLYMLLWGKNKEMKMHNLELVDRTEEREEHVEP